MENLTVIEYKDIRVLTTQQIAEAYETNTDTITKNFNRNKDRYKEGKHFICLKGNELKEFKTNGQIDLLPNVNTLYLWTEKGAFLHAKSLNTDVAWEVYDRLVDDYFTKKDDVLQGLSQELQAVIVVDKRVTKIEKRVDHLENDIPLYGAEADELCNHVKRRGVDILGGKKSKAYKDNKIRTAVYTDIYNQIKREFGLYDDKGRFKSYKALKRRYIYEAHEVIDCYVLPTYLAEQISNCNKQFNLEDYENAV